jgi:hypothetical protein
MRFAAGALLWLSEETGVEFPHGDALWTILFRTQGAIGASLGIARGARKTVTPLLNTVQPQAGLAEPGPEPAE